LVSERSAGRALGSKLTSLFSWELRPGDPSVPGGRNRVTGRRGAPAGVWLGGYPSSCPENRRAANPRGSRPRDLGSEIPAVTCCWSAQGSSAPVLRTTGPPTHTHGPANGCVTHQDTNNGGAAAVPSSPEPGSPPKHNLVSTPHRARPRSGAPRAVPPRAPRTAPSAGGPPPACLPDRTSCDCSEPSRASSERASGPNRPIHDTGLMDG
jgi:hypothetical protein